MNGNLNWLWLLLVFLIIAFLILWLGRRKEAVPRRMARQVHPVDHSRPGDTPAIPEAKEAAGLPDEPSSAAMESAALVGVPPLTRAVQDDLQVIEGIGPKIAALLRKEGIDTFAVLAATSTARLEDILTRANLQRLARPATWPRQADLASQGRWEDLKAYQETLKGGREVSA